LHNHELFSIKSYTNARERQNVVPIYRDQKYYTFKNPQNILTKKFLIKLNLTTSANKGNVHK